MLKHLSEVTGHSISTVAQVLHSAKRTELFKEQTRQEIKQAAAKLGYRRNQSARATRTGRTGFIAFLTSLDHVRAPFEPTVLASICDALKQDERHLIIKEASNKELVDEKIMPSFLHDLSANGLLINYHVGAPAEFTRLLERFHLPAIWINTRKNENACYPDEYQAGQQLTQYFIDQGHQEIVFASFHRPDFVNAHFSLRDRLQGYQDAMTAAGLQPVLALSEHKHPFEIKGGRLREAQQMMAQNQKTTAYICYNLILAHATSHAIHRSGKTVPEDIEIGVFHTRQEDCPGMVVSIIPYLDIGKAVVEMLSSHIKTNKPVAALSFPAQLVLET